MKQCVYGTPQSAVETVAQHLGVSPIQNNPQVPYVMITPSLIEYNEGIPRLCRGLIEVDPTDCNLTESALFAMPPVVTERSLFMSLTSGSAFTYNIRHHVMTSLQQRRLVPDNRLKDIELALQEGIANAVLHGNLGVGRLPEDPNQLIAYENLITEKLEDATYASKRIALSVTSEREWIDIAIYDQGNWDGKCQSERSYQGMNQIARCTDAYRYDTKHHVLTLWFDR